MGNTCGDGGEFGGLRGSRGLHFTYTIFQNRINSPLGVGGYMNKRVVCIGGALVDELFYAKEEMMAATTNMVTLDQNA
jgi:hypothetical protein